MAENVAVNSVVETGCFAETSCRPSSLLKSLQCSGGLVRTELNTRWQYSDQALLFKILLCLLSALKISRAVVHVGFFTSTL